MRDIRQDLKERIAAEAARREPLQAAIEQIDQNIDSLTSLLAQEESRASGNGVDKTVHARPTGPLQDYLLRMLGKGPKSLEELRASATAAGYFEGSSESPGRAVHSKLLNPIRAGHVARDEDKKYRLVAKD